MSEKNFRGRLNAAALKCRDVIDWMPVENRAMKSMPDQYSVNQYGTSCWVELKYVQRVDEKIKFQPGQARWLKKHWQRGGCSYIAIYCGDARRIYVYNGCDAEKLEKLGHCGDIGPEEIFETPKRELIMMRWFAGKNKR